jgi:rhomboid protease GluP
VRQRQGSIVCANCGKLVGISESSCPYCGAWRPGLFGWTPILQRLVGQRLDLVSLILATCITLYAVALLLQPEAIFGGGGLLSILSPGTRALYQLGMTGGVAWDQGWWWTLLTANYLHGGLLHILFNMMWVRNLGPVATELYGPGRTFVLFNVAGVSGFLLSNLMTASPTIGASGAVFGLLAALIVYGRRRGSGTMERELWQWAILLFVFGFIMRGVNNWAHAGGFAGGWIAAQLMGFIDEQRESATMLVASLVLIALTAVGIVLSFVKVTSVLLGS